jgi:hypothetical protein
LRQNALLCKIPIIALLGNAPATSLPENEEEMRKLVTATALSGSPILFLDNCKGHLKSSSLEALTTSPAMKFRLLGANKIIEAEHGITVFITTNRATFSPDLRRRTLIVPLFLEEVRPELRIIRRPLDDAAIIARRADVLAASLAFVREWEKQGFPKAKVLNQSFFAWSQVVGGILESVGYPSPCSPSQGFDGGDLELIQMEKLVNSMQLGRAYNVPIWSN